MSICYDVHIHFIGCVWENNEPKERQKAMNRKIWKALGIAVCMLALAAPRAMAETNSHYVSDGRSFKKAIETINNSKDKNENEIILMNGFTLEGDTTEYTLRRGTTTIKGEGNTITVNSGAGIKVTGEKTTLNLGANGYDKKLTIDGNAKGAFITVSGGATAYMYENVTLQNREQVDQACVVLEENSVFTMYGGVIQNCKGKYGGVSLKNGSGFIMEGGTISECSASEGGGLYAENSTVTIKGGTISRCSAYAGGGLYADNSAVTISKGTISGCSASNGGGLCAENFSTIEISGGTISGCTTSEAGMGGGLYAYKSTITISRGTIENNKATYGGGVALNSSTINPITNWTVIGNEAYKTKRGNGGIGGGIYLDYVSMNVSAGSNRIYNNQAEGHGADICMEIGASIKLPIAANMGATFGDSGINIDGWYKDKPRYEPSKDVDPVDVSETLTNPRSLVASYKADPVRIEIDANGGVGGSGSQTVHKGTTVTLEAPTKEGHLFKGWKDEKGNSYPAGEDGKVKITVTGAMALTAVWKDRTFTVTYVLLDGKTRTETAAYGQNVTLGEEPRTGYTFVGWKDGEKVYHAGETITVTEDKTLTAVWEARTFTVTYVLLNGETRTEKVDYGQMVTLSEEPRTGYTFVGWKDGEKMYHAGETITVTGDMTLTAEWKKLPSAENLPKTGDESPVLLWGAALAVSAAACFMLRRRK